MSGMDLMMMEAQLGVTLPADYKAALAAFPWPELVGETEFSLWDDAALNIERTLGYRKGYGGAPPWPKEYVHIGDDDDACPYALRCGDGTIVKTDHCNLSASPLEGFRSTVDFVCHLQEVLDREGDV